MCASHRTDTVCGGDAVVGRGERRTDFGITISIGGQQRERFVMLVAAADAMDDNGDKIWINSSLAHHHIKQLITNPELDKDVIITRR